MGAGPDSAGDLVEMALHGVRVGPRHDDRRPGAARRADRAEEIGRAGAQVLGRPGPTAPPGPAPGQRVLLAEPHLVLEPELHRRPGGQAVHDLRQPLGEELFLNASISSGSCS